MLSRCLLSIIFASELSRKLVKSALLVGQAEAKEVSLLRRDLLAREKAGCLIALLTYYTVPLWRKLQEIKLKFGTLSSDIVQFSGLRAQSFMFQGICALSF